MNQIVFVPYTDEQEAQNRLLAIIDLEQDVNLINQMFADLNFIIQSQQKPISVIVAQIEETKRLTISANDDVEKIHEYSIRKNTIFWKVVAIGASTILFMKVFKVFF